MKIPYTTKVKLFKIVLLSIIIGTSLFFLITPMVYLKLRSNEYTFASHMLHNFLKKEVIPPVLSGTTRNGGAYYLSAEKVTNNLISFNYKEGNIIHVTKPSLMYNTNKNGLIFSLLSDIGIIDTNKNTINIPGTVFITSNQNYKATLYKVSINFKYSTLESNNPLTAFSEDKVITANGIIINQKNNFIILKGPVVIKPTKNFNSNK